MMKALMTATFLISIAVDVRAAETLKRTNELKVSLLTPKVESMTFDKIQTGGSSAESVSYMIDEKPIRARVVPESMYRRMLMTFPISERVKAKADCKPSVSIERAGKAPQLVCDEALSKAQRLSFSKWFRETRLKLME